MLRMFPDNKTKTIDALNLNVALQDCKVCDKVLVLDGNGRYFTITDVIIRDNKVILVVSKNTISKDY